MERDGRRRLREGPDRSATIGCRRRSLCLSGRHRQDKPARCAPPLAPTPGAVPLRPQKGQRRTAEEEQRAQIRPDRRDLPRPPRTPRRNSLPPATLRLRPRERPCQHPSAHPRYYRGRRTPRHTRQLDERPKTGSEIFVTCSASAGRTGSRVRGLDAGVEAPSCVAGTHGHGAAHGGPRRVPQRLCGQGAEGRLDRGHGPRFHAAPRPKLLVCPPL